MKVAGSKKVDLKLGIATNFYIQGKEPLLGDTGSYSKLITRSKCFSLLQTSSLLKHPFWQNLTGNMVRCAISTASPNRVQKDGFELQDIL